MTLKRIEPLTTTYDLGYVLLWQDDLAKVIRLMSELNSSSITIEADGYTLTDVAADLPNIGTKRINSFTASVTRPGKDDQDDSTLSIELSKDKTTIETINADLMTSGAQTAISSLMERCERMPRGEAGRFLRGGSGMGLVWTSILTIVVIVFIYMALIAFTGIGLYGFESKNSPVLPSAVVVTFFFIAVFLGTLWLYASNQVRALMYAGTREQAPTWWQRNRSNILINVVNTAFSLTAGTLLGYLINR